MIDQNVRQRTKEGMKRLLEKRRKEEDSPDDDKLLMIEPGVVKTVCIKKDQFSQPILESQDEYSERKPPKIKLRKIHPFKDKTQFQERNINFQDLTQKLDENLNSYKNKKKMVFASDSKDFSDQNEEDKLYENIITKYNNNNDNQNNAYDNKNYGRNNLNYNQPNNYYTEIKVDDDSEPQRLPSTNRGRQSFPHQINSKPSLQKRYSMPTAVHDDIERQMSKNDSKRRNSKSHSSKNRKDTSNTSQSKQVLVVIKRPDVSEFRIGSLSEHGKTYRSFNKELRGTLRQLGFGIIGSGIILAFVYFTIEDKEKFLEGLTVVPMRFWIISSLILIGAVAIYLIYHKIEEEKMLEKIAEEDYERLLKSLREKRNIEEFIGVFKLKFIQDNCFRRNFPIGKYISKVLPLLELFVEQDHLIAEKEVVISSQSQAIYVLKGK